MTRTIRSAIYVVILVLAGSVHAQESQSFENFTFKRVKVPGAGQTNRINIQIDPAEQAARLAPRAPKPEIVPVAVTPKVPTAAYAWYWSVISPSSSDAAGGRLEEAVNHLKNSPPGQAVPTPRLQSLQNIAAKHGVAILSATIGTSISPAFALAVISTESSGRVDAVSSAGAQGLMQLIPETAKRFGVEKIDDPVENIKGGVAYLDWLMGQFDNDPLLVLAAYNSGENAVRRHEGVPPYAETRAYVPKVLSAWTVARGLCLTPPQLVSDGCVFLPQEAKN